MGPTLERRLLGLAVAVIVFTAAGAAWLVYSISDLANRIMPGFNMQVSTSMEPYDVVLRAATKGGKLLDSSARPMEWAIRLPRTYVTSELGDNGATYRRTSGGGDEYFLDFQVNISADGQTFVPTAGRPPEDQKVRSMIFHIRNAEAIPSIRNYESCVPQHLRNTILERRGSKLWRNEECTDRGLRCQVWTHVDGWMVNLAVTKDLYADPGNACRLARKFLDTYTVKRDDVR